MKISPPLAALALAASTLVIPSLVPAAVAAQPAPSTDAAFRATTLTLSSQGAARSRPDQAQISLGVMTEAPTAAEALRLNSERMTRVIAAVRRASVEERRIQTSGLSLSPQYTYAENQPPRLRGYQASNQVTVTIHELDRLGAIVDAAVTAGANQVNGIGFGLRNPDAAADEARRQAVANLQRRAELYAAAAGLRLLRLVNLTESGGYQPQPPVVLARMQMADTAASAPVSPGEVEVRVDVTATYELAR